MTDSSGVIVVTCAKGIAPYLSKEISSLGYPILEESAGGVKTSGGILGAMSLNLGLRTGHRVLLKIGEVQTWEPEELKKKLYEIEWERYVPEDGYLSVMSSVDTPAIRNSRYANQVVKDDVCGRLRHICGRRPDSGSEKKVLSSTSTGAAGSVSYIWIRPESRFPCVRTADRSLMRR